MGQHTVKYESICQDKKFSIGKQDRNPLIYSETHGNPKISFIE